MSEKVPRENNGNEETPDNSRRAFLKNIGGLGAAVALGGVMYLKGRSEDHPETFKEEGPYHLPVAELSREETMREIVHNEGRIIRLNTLKGEGAETGVDGPQNVDIKYFLERYSEGGD